MRLKIFKYIEKPNEFLGEKDSINSITYKNQLNTLKLMRKIDDMLMMDCNILRRNCLHWHYPIHYRCMNVASDHHRRHFEVSAWIARHPLPSFILYSIVYLEKKDTLSKKRDYIICDKNGARMKI